MAQSLHNCIPRRRAADLRASLGCQCARPQPSGLSGYREYMWFTGPCPLPRAYAWAMAPLMYSLAPATALGTSLPRARRAAIAAERVQPVPWVLLVRTLGAR